MYPKTNSDINNDANETKNISNKENNRSEKDEIVNNDQFPKLNDQFTTDNSKPSASNFITDYYASLFIEPS